MVGWLVPVTACLNPLILDGGMMAAVNGNKMLKIIFLRKEERRGRLQPLLCFLKVEIPCEKLTRLQMHNWKQK